MNERIESEAKTIEVEMITQPAPAPAIRYQATVRPLNSEETAVLFSYFIADMEC